MKGKLRAILSTAVAIAAVAVLPTAVMAVTYIDSLAGAEIYATDTEGRFAGAATGSLAGAWYIDVLHKHLTTQAQITGGTFSLATVLNNRPAVVQGNFTGGSVNQTGGLTGCTNQTYALSGSLGAVGAQGGSHTGTGQFDGMLTHYRHSVAGYCVTYSASVTGTVSFTF